MHVQNKYKVEETVATCSGRRIKLGEQWTTVQCLSLGWDRGTKCVENAEETGGL